MGPIYIDFLESRVHNAELILDMCVLSYSVYIYMNKLM